MNKPLSLTTIEFLQLGGIPFHCWCKFWILNNTNDCFPQVTMPELKLVLLAFKFHRNVTFLKLQLIMSTKNIHEQNIHTRDRWLAASSQRALISLWFFTLKVSPVMILHTTFIKALTWEWDMAVSSIILENSNSNSKWNGSHGLALIFDASEWAVWP